MTAPKYLIERDSADGKSKRRVYVTGPHFGGSLSHGVYSSTENRDEASCYSEKDARALVRLKWQASMPEVVADDHATSTPQQDAP